MCSTCRFWVRFTSRLKESTALVSVELMETSLSGKDKTLTIAFAGSQRDCSRLSMHSRNLHGTTENRINTADMYDRNELNGFDIPLRSRGKVERRWICELLLCPNIKYLKLSAEDDKPLLITKKQLWRSVKEANGKQTTQSAVHRIRILFRSMLGILSTKKNQQIVVRTATEKNVHLGHSFLCASAAICTYSCLDNSRFTTNLERSQTKIKRGSDGLRGHLDLGQFPLFLLPSLQIV